MMINLPKSCIVYRNIPKKTLYQKASIDNKTKKKFVDEIEKITWMYKIAPDTLGVSKTDQISEIEFFEVLLKKRDFSIKTFNSIRKNISYPILFKIAYEEDICYGIGYQEQFYFSEWNKEVNFDFSALNLEYLFQKLIKSIVGIEDSKEDLDEILEKIRKREELSRNIDIISKKIQKENQFNRKIDLNRELNKLKRDMEDLL